MATADGEYASHLLKAGSAAQPKGCSTCFVPAFESQTKYYPDLCLSRRKKHIDSFASRLDIVQNDMNCTHDAEETAYFLRRTGY